MRGINIKVTVPPPREATQLGGRQGRKALLKVNPSSFCFITLQRDNSPAKEKNPRNVLGKTEGVTG